jgi:phage terminase large subunit-like protein
MAEHRVTQYARAVVSGEIVAGQFVRQACQRHLDDLEHGAERGLYFDERAADHVIDFFPFLRHSKGEWAGQPFVLQLWQMFIAGSLFGWKRADGTRRFRRGYIEVPRKNGKSTFVSGLGLYLLLADGEPGAEVYTAATKRDQARIVHGEATRMVRASPMLRKRVGIYKDNLHVAATCSKYEPLGADADTMDGLNVHGALIDEVHAHKTRAVIDVIDTAIGARRQPLLIEITTAGWDRKSVCWEHHDYSRQVLERVIPDDAWFAYVATIDKDDDWTDPTTWAKANPNLGVSVKREALEAKARRAKLIPAEQNSFLRLHLDVWTEQSERWMPLDEWDACARSIELEKLIGRPCYAGLDLASTIDIAALVLVFPSDDDPPIYDVLCFFWVPAETVAERTRRSNVPYLSWVEQGLITATEGNVIDYRAIGAKLDELAQTYSIQEIAYDRWGATQLIQDLQAGGLEVVPFGQGFFSMSPPTKELMNLVLAERIRHGGNPVLRWMASNVMVQQDAAGNLKPDKAKSAEKIDGIVALIEGVDRATRQTNTGSPYDDRGLLIL